MNEHERDQVQADALDAYLSQLQAGVAAPRSDVALPEQAAFAKSLVELAKANPPDAAFAARLETRLHAAARERVSRTHPRFWKRLQGIGAEAAVGTKERTFNMNRRFVYMMSGAAVLTLILLAALVLYQNIPAVGPGQVAQLPTMTPTSSPTVVPTPTSLPPTTVPTAAIQETRLPAATPTAKAVLPTAVPAVTPTPTPGEPISLPSLARWMEAGYGGGGTGEPIATKKTFVLGIELPQGPGQIKVYLQREPEKLTAAYAAQMAGRLGVQGEVYQSIRLASVPNPEDEPFRGYLAVDGARQVMFEATGIARYTDRNRIPYVEGYWREPGAMPPLAEAVQTAEAFLRAAGLLEGDYQMTAGGGTLSFCHVLDGQWPLVEPFVRVSMWSDGQIGEVVYIPQTLDVLAEYPIISAQEAWAILSLGQSDERLWQNPYRSPAMSPWGEWQHQNPTFWQRSYQAGQQIHRFGVPQVWFPIEADGMPYIRIGDLVLTGDVQPLAEYTLQQYAREQWNYVHVWGEVQDAGDHLTLAVEGWEPAEETYWSGTLQRQGDEGTLITGDGRTIALSELPADLADGAQIAVLGGPVNDRLEWYLIQEMDITEPVPGPRVANLQMTVEQIDLVYLSLASSTISPERATDLAYRAVQPVWRFRGHSDQGTAFEVYVQAVQSSYIAE